MLQPFSVDKGHSGTATGRRVRGPLRSLFESGPTCDRLRGVRKNAASRLVPRRRWERVQLGTRRWPEGWEDGAFSHWASGLDFEYQMFKVGQARRGDVGGSIGVFITPSLARKRAASVLHCINSVKRTSVNEVNSSVYVCWIYPVGCFCRRNFLEMANKDAACKPPDRLKAKARLSFNFPAKGRKEEHLAIARQYLLERVSIH